MTWRTDKPETIGDYIILIPEIIGPIQDFPQQITGTVSRAWFDGEVFIQSTGVHHNIGSCAWVPSPSIFFLGFGDDGPILEIRE